MKLKTASIRSLSVAATLALILGGAACTNSTSPANMGGPGHSTADNGGAGTGAPVSHVGPTGAGPAGSQ